MRFGLAAERRGAFVRGLAVFAFALFILFQMDGSRQPTSGSGWRVLGYQRGVAGSADVVALADASQLDDAWARLRLKGEPQAADFDRTAVFWVTATGSIGCPAHFAGVDVDPARRVATARFTWALASGCDASRVPDSFLLAIDRDRLPNPPFALELRGPPPIPRP